jgi:hypothetical protein
MAAAMVLIGLAAGACGTIEPDPNSFQFVESRRDN